MRAKGWLAASSAERTRELVRAINTLAIDSKLRLAGSPELNNGEVDDARERLLEFVRRLSVLIGEAQQNRPVVGADPQLSRIVRTLVSPTGAAHLPRLSAESINQLRLLLEKPLQDADLNQLIVDLRALRQVLERSSQREPRVR